MEQGVISCILTVEGLNARILNAWKSCPRKKLVAAAAVTTFWNLVSVKTRVMAGMSLMIDWTESSSRQLAHINCLTDSYVGAN